MTFHHIIREDDQVRGCPYCGKKVSPKKWRSGFSDTNAHYKEFRCSCGKRLSIRMDFMGSGDDSWHRNLDRRIEEEEEE